jgi:hypothetical protein
MPTTRARLPALVPLALLLALEHEQLEPDLVEAAQDDGATVESQRRVGELVREPSVLIIKRPGAIARDVERSVTTAT